MREISPVGRWLRILVMVFLAACAPKVEERSRVTSPSKKVDAVIAVRDTGATVATPTVIYLLAANAPIIGDPMIVADGVEGLSLEWVDDATLIINADTARLFKKPDAPVAVPGTAVAPVTVRIQVRSASGRQ